MKTVYVGVMILFTMLFSGCSATEQSSYGNDSAHHQKSQSKKALQDLEKE